MNVWLVNSNSKEENGNPNGFIFMLRQNKISAFYNRKVSIDKIKFGDMVLLYHNSNRIIAVGFALDYQSHDFEEMKNVEHWVNVNWIWKCNFDFENNNYLAKNTINRNKIGIRMVRNVVNNVTNQINLDQLLAEIGKKQNLVI